MKLKLSFFLIFIPLCFHLNAQVNNVSINDSESKCTLTILGTVQDGGSPHAGCRKDCCSVLFERPDPKRRVVCLGLIDNAVEKNWIIEASPDLPSQMEALQRMSDFVHAVTPDGILLTHAHIGHYTGLMYLGKEAMNSNKVKVYAMDRMTKFLRNNGPWSQLVSLNNINLINIHEGQSTQLSPHLKFTPIVVPHRDEYSETVGFIIEGSSKKVLFIPDIDKWSIWEKDIVKLIGKIDLAFIDATFFDGNETPNREISEIPHPYVIESMTLFNDLSMYDKSKIHFIHFNHTNPLLNNQSKEYKSVKSKGFGIAEIGMSWTL